MGNRFSSSDRLRLKYMKLLSAARNERKVIDFCTTLRSYIGDFSTDSSCLENAGLENTLNMTEDDIFDKISDCIANHLICENIDVNFSGLDCYDTPLQFAQFKYYHKLTIVLLKSGATFTVSSADGSSVVTPNNDVFKHLTLLNAYQHNNYALFRALVRARADIQPELLSIHTYDEKTLNFLDALIKHPAVDINNWRDTKVHMKHDPRERYAKGSLLWFAALTENEPLFNMMFLQCDPNVAGKPEATKRNASTPIDLMMIENRMYDIIFTRCYKYRVTNYEVKSSSENFELESCVAYLTALPKSIDIYKRMRQKYLKRFMKHDDFCVSTIAQFVKVGPVASLVYDYC